MELLNPTVHAPEFPHCHWVNALRPISMASLRGHIVLIDIWDFTCINCLRTLPYLRAWHQRYAEQGLSIIGVHTPEFTFARDKDQVKTAVGRLGISWPVILDNEQRIWQSFANRYWPTIYLIDSEGYIRYQHAGESGYAKVERVIQSLLREIDLQAKFPHPIAPLRPEDQLGAACHPITPEMHVDAIGNQQIPIKTPLLFRVPQVRLDGKFYLNGWWQTARDGLTLAGERGSILLRYHAASVNEVFSPSPEPVDQNHSLCEPVFIDLYQDGESLPKACYTEDLYNEEGKTRLRVDQARCYALMQHSEVLLHELLIKINRVGLTFYTFSFGSCLQSIDESQIKPQE
jgi:thiol-disulfide isomerase/thioredoxin